METDKTIYLRNIPARRSDSNKGTYGKILVAAGSEGMCGAAYLAALAAYRSGAGLVRILTPECNRLIVQSLLPEAIFTGYDTDSNFRVLSDANVSWADIIVLGPGLGTEALSVTLVRELLQAIALRCDIAMEGNGVLLGEAEGAEEDTEKRLMSETSAPSGEKSENSLTSEHTESSEKARSEWGRKFPLLLIDADGLNILSARPELMQLVDQIALQLPVVVTPHPMEMARLSAASLQEILQCPAHAAEALAEAHGTITVMKGSETIVMDPDGHAFRNPEASPALSKAAPATYCPVPSPASMLFCAPIGSMHCAKLRQKSSARAGAGWPLTPPSPASSFTQKPDDRPQTSTEPTASSPTKLQTCSAS